MKQYDTLDELQEIVSDDNVPEWRLTNKKLGMKATELEWQNFMRDLPKNPRERFLLIRELVLASTYVQGI